MIIEALWNAIVTVITTLFSVIPSLPSMPTAVTDAADAVINIAEIPVHFLHYIFTPVLLNAVIAIFVAVFIYEKGYTGVIFVLKKIPFLGIK